MEPAAQPESSRAKVALGCSIVSTHHRKMVSDGDNAAHPAKIDCDARKTFEKCTRPGGSDGGGQAEGGAAESMRDVTLRQLLPATLDKSAKLSDAPQSQEAHNDVCPLAA